jgi:hypothetical protein
MRRAGIEPAASANFTFVRWEALILPLNHRHVVDMFAF